MDINNYRFRGKDNITKKWLFGTLRIENNTPLVNDRLVDSDTLGQLAPRQDSDAHLVFEGDIILKSVLWLNTVSFPFLAMGLFVTVGIFMYNL